MAKKPEVIRLGSQKYLRFKELYGEGKGEGGSHFVAGKGLSAGLSAAFAQQFRGLSQEAQAAAIKTATSIINSGHRAEAQREYNLVLPQTIGPSPSASPKLPTGETAPDANSPFWKRKEFEDYVNSELRPKQQEQIRIARVLNADERQESIAALQQIKQAVPSTPNPLVNQVLSGASMAGSLAHLTPQQTAWLFQKLVGIGASVNAYMETAGKTPSTVSVNPKAPGQTITYNPLDVSKSKADYRGNALGGLQPEAAQLYANIQAARTPVDVTGQPIEVDVSEASNIAQIQNANGGPDTWSSKLAVATYKIESAIKTGVNWMGLPSKWTMLIGTDDNPTLVGSVINFAQNAMMALGSDLYLKALINPMNSLLKPEQFDQRADELENSILNGTWQPTIDAKGNRQTLQQAKMQIENDRGMATWLRQAQSNAIDWYNRYATGAHESWAKLAGGTWDSERNLYAPPTPPAFATHTMFNPATVNAGQAKQLAEYNIKYDRYVAALNRAKDLSVEKGTEANQFYQDSTTAQDPDAANLLANRALDLQVEKLRYQRLSDPLDHFGSYTWESEPERYNAFLRDVAMFELQVGRDASNSEIERIKDKHINMFTDLVGQAVFDPVWLLQPGAESVVKGGVTILGDVGNVARKLEVSAELGSAAKLVFKGGKLKEAAKLLEEGKVIKPIDVAYRFFFEQAHSSVANQIGRVVYDTLERIRPTYNTSDEFIDDIRLIGSEWLDVERKYQTGQVDDAIKAFDALKDSHPGLNQITFDDFRKFADSMKAADGSYLVEPAQWAEILKDGRTNAIAARKTQALIVARRTGQDLQDPAVWGKIEKEAAEWVNDVNKSGEFVSELQSAAEKAYLDVHRSYKGSRLIEDTVSGAIAKYFYQKGGGWKQTAELMDALTGAAIKVRSVWSNAVLNLNPARVIRNLIDSMGRDIIYGGSAWDDLGTLFANTQLHFVDDVGFIPVEFGQSLARAGLDFTESVPSRLLYGEDKPMFGIFSYWDYEAKRKEVEALEKGLQGAVTREEIASKLAELMPSGVKGHFKAAFDGLKYHWNLSTISSAMADYNTAIEFTLRLRMFHRSYFDLMKQLEPEFKIKGMENLSPQAKMLAKEIWEMSKGSPAKMAAYADAVMGRNTKLLELHPEWSYSLPEDFGRGVPDPEHFVASVRKSVDDFITGTYKAKGRLPNQEEINTWVLDAKNGLREETLRRMETNITRAEASADLGTQMAKTPSNEELAGATEAIVHPPKSPSQKVEEFRRGRPPLETRDAYAAAMEPYAKVMPIKGNQVIARKAPDGSIVIEVGDALMTAKNPAQLYKGMHEATIKAFAIHNEELIYSKGMDITTFTNRFKGFLADPLRVRNEAEDTFVSFVRMMDDNPDIYTMLRKTGKVQSYEQAAINYRKFGALKYYDELGWNDYKGMVEAAEHLAHPRLPIMLERGNLLNDATGNLSKRAFDINDRELDMLLNHGGVTDLMGRARTNFETFTRTVFPGYMGKSGDLRQQALKDMDAMIAEEYGWEIGFKTGLNEGLTKDLEGVKSSLRAIPRDRAEFSKWFLEQNGFTMTFDEQGRLSKAKVLLGGRETVLSDMQTSQLRKLFFEKLDQPLRRVVSIDSAGNQADHFRQLIDSFSLTFGMNQKESAAMARYMTEQAKWWKSMGGGDEEEYLARFGWEKVEGVRRWGRTKGQMEMVRRGMVVKDPEHGLMMFYGSGSHDLPSFMRQASLIYYNDLQDLAKINKTGEVAEMLKTIHGFLGVKEGEVANAAQIEKFRDAMMSYIINGKTPNIALKRPFESFSRSLERTYGAILGEENLLHLPEDVMGVLNKNFAARKLVDAPSSAPRVTRTMAKEAGINATEDDILRAVNASNTRRSENALREFIDQRYGPNISDELRQKLLSDLKDLHDPLTGVETVRSIASNPIPQGWVVGTSDFNGLKPVNDVFGHEKGDSILKQLGAKVNEVVDKVNQEAGTVVARVYRGGVGADEFSYAFRDQATADKVFNAIDDAMNGLQLDIGEGSKMRTFKGFSVAHGTGATQAEAETGLQAAKASDLKAGKRALRGEMPLSIKEVGQEEAMPESFAKWYKKEYGISEPSEVQRAWKEDPEDVTKFHQYMSGEEQAKPPSQMTYQLKYEPIKGTLTENLDKVTTMKVSEMPEPLAKRFKATAEDLLREINAPAGRRVPIKDPNQMVGEYKYMAQATENPTWYAKYDKQAGVGTGLYFEQGARKPQIKKALQRIIDGNNDRGKISTELKKIIVERLQGVEGEYVPDMVALHMMGATPAELESSMGLFEGLNAMEGGNVVDAMLYKDATADEIENYLHSLELTGEPGKPLAAAASTPPTPAQVASGATRIDRRGVARVYTDLGDVPLEERARAIQRLGGTVNPQIHDQIQQAFETWKTRREFVGFPPESLKDPVALKAYLKERYLTSEGEMARYYSERLWDVEQFENAIINYQVPKNLGQQKKAWESFTKGLHQQMADIDTKLADPKLDPFEKRILSIRRTQMQEVLDTGITEERIPIYRGTARNTMEQGGKGNWWSTDQHTALSYSDHFSDRPGEIDVAYIKKSEWEKAREAARAEDTKRGWTWEPGGTADLHYGVVPGTERGQNNIDFFPDWELGYDEEVRRTGLNYKGLKPITFEGTVPPRVTNDDIIGDMLSPRVPTWMRSQGGRTWYEANLKNMSQFEAAEQEFDRLGRHLTSGNGFHQTLPSNVVEELQAWKTQAVNNKAQLISLGLNGGSYNGANIEGAVEKTNRVMLDYSYRTRFDNLMRNIFPFWQFPSRSWPFWVETLSSKPEIVAAYSKLQNLSRQARYQRGAVTSTGKPMPSLEGYMPIPGTDLWFNPMAPFSFSYLLGYGANPDNVLYQSKDSQDDVPPMAAMAQTFIDSSQIYGFSMAPWTSWLTRKAFNVSDSVAPQWPILPQIQLFPRWMVADYIDKANRMTVAGRKGWGDAIYPEVTWHDFLVERDMLEQANQNIQGMDAPRAMAYLNQIATAIAEKGENPVWKQAYQNYTSSEAGRANRSFFTGFYTKPFSDVDADMLKLRNENNLMKSAMNNRFQAAFFKIPTDANDAWDEYIHTQDTPEGWLYRLYTDIGWVRDSQGNLATDPAERAKLLAAKIQQDENDALYYRKVADLQVDLQAKMRAIPIGADWQSQIQPALDQYYAELKGISYLHSPTTGFGTNKPVELIKQDLVNEWWRTLNQTKPIWDTRGGETYDTYQTRVAQWKSALPAMATKLHYDFLERDDIISIINNLHDDQPLGKDFFTNLVASTNSTGYDQWQLSNDTLFDALNTAWQKSYWEPYWDAHKDPTSPTGWKQGSQYELADYDFLAAHPQPPTAEELYATIQSLYGDRFSLEDVQKWVGYDDTSNVLSIAQRQEQGQDPDWQQRQDIWSILSMLGPGKNRSILESALDSAQYQDLQNWYSSNGSLWQDQPDKLQSFHDALEQKAAAMNFQKPTRDDLVQFITAEEQNNQFHQAVASDRNRTWEDVNTILNTYYDLGSKTFRAEHPDDYRDVVQPYYTLRDTWGKTHPEWASYYMWEQKPSNLSNVTPVPAGPTPASPQQQTYPTESPEGLLKPGTGQTKTSPTATELVNGQVWPSGLKAVISKDLAWEIGQKILNPDYTRISNAGVTAIRTLMTTHPEWSTFLTRLLIPPKGHV